MIDTATISDYNLALYVDEYVKRAMNIANSAGVSDTISINITASRYGVNSDYEIKHRASITNYPESNSVEGNNAIAAMRKVVNRWEDDRVEKPTKVTLMITSTNNDHIEEAEFTPAPSDDIF